MERKWTRLVRTYTDGGEDIRDLPQYLNPQTEHHLDWFHVTMCLTVLRQMTRFPPEPSPDQDEDTIVPFYGVEWQRFQSTAR